MAIVPYMAQYRTATAWRYENADSPGFKNTLWVLDNGLVNYIGRSGESGWHGNFALDNESGMLRLRFDYRGRIDQMKFRFLLRRGDGIFQGYDYANRSVTITRLREYRWDEHFGRWH